MSDFVLEKFLGFMFGPGWWDFLNLLGKQPQHSILKLSNALYYNIKLYSKVITHYFCYYYFTLDTFLPFLQPFFTALGLDPVVSNTSLILTIYSCSIPFSLLISSMIMPLLSISSLIFVSISSQPCYLQAISSLNWLKAFIISWYESLKVFLNSVFSSV